MLQPAQTRWLSLICVVKRILEQYEALKLYFQAESSDGIESANEILNNLLNSTTKLYLEILEYTLPIFIDLNLEFQAESPRIHLTYDHVKSAYLSVLKCYLKPQYVDNTDVSAIQYRNPSNFKPLENIHCGPKVAVALQRKLLSKDEEKQLKVKCLDFYVECAHQIYSRFPFNSEQIKSISPCKLVID